MRIPMRGAIGSLNAAVAGSVLLYEAVAQRDPDGRGPTPNPTTAPMPEAPVAAIGEANAPVGTTTDTAPEEAPSDASAADLLPGGPLTDEAAKAPKPAKPRKPRTPHA
jgi:hypothetical protein